MTFCRVNSSLEAAPTRKRRLRGADTTSEVMRFLFLHNNFPGQFKNLAPAFAKRPGWSAAAIGGPTSRALPDIPLVKTTSRRPRSGHPFASEFESDVARAEQAMYAAASLRSEGFAPDVVIGHSGWGLMLPMREIFPKARIVSYCEWYYGAGGADIGFDPEFPAPTLDSRIRLRARNAGIALGALEADVRVSPTYWQRKQFPEAMRRRIHVAHDGVDPAPLDAAPPRFALPDGETVLPGEEIVTFVTRSLEPYRGFHIFCRALRRILARRPTARALIVGNDGVSYGMQSQMGGWRKQMRSELGDAVDWRRVHFLGRVPYKSFCSLLKVSSAHVYLTYPFVLSWSLIEALMAGCLVVASDTDPVREVIRDGENGVLTPFFDVESLADRVIEALADPARHDARRATARRLARRDFDFATVAEPAWRELALG